MDKIIKITKRELFAYFTTPIGYVFLIIFLLMNWILFFERNQFFESNNASLAGLFETIYLTFVVFIPAVGMRLWSEERRYGTIELLLTLPVTIKEAVIGKFLAAWIFVLIALLLTTTIVFTLLYLGEPDMGVIAINYLGTFLIAGAYLSISSFASALSKNQVVSFILSVSTCFIFYLLGSEMLLSVLERLENYKSFESIVHIVSYLGFSNHLDSVQKGIIDTRDIIYFGTFIVAVIFLNIKLINYNKAK